MPLSAPGRPACRLRSFASFAVLGTSDMRQNSQEDLAPPANDSKVPGRATIGDAGVHENRVSNLDMWYGSAPNPVVGTPLRVGYCKNDDFIDEQLIPHIVRKPFQKAAAKIATGTGRFKPCKRPRRRQDAEDRVLVLVDELLAKSALPVVVPLRTFCKFNFGRGRHSQFHAGRLSRSRFRTRSSEDFQSSAIIWPVS